MQGSEKTLIFEIVTFNTFFYHFQTNKVRKSKLEKLRTVIAKLVATAEHNVDIFSVRSKQEWPPWITDVRFSAMDTSAVLLNGFVMQNRRKVIALYGSVAVLCYLVFRFINFII